MQVCSNPRGVICLTQVLAGQRTMKVFRGEALMQVSSNPRGETCLMQVLVGEALMQVSWGVRMMRGLLSPGLSLEDELEDGGEQ